LTRNEVPSLTSVIEAAMSSAIERSLPELAGADPVIRRSEHADYQSNAALPLAKRARTSPVALAATLADSLGSDTGAPIAAVTVSGPGFLNVTVANSALWNQVAARLASDRLGVGTPETGRRTVIDYSAPNIAKEMHVGHLRTTIIGDSLVRVLGFLGGDVVRQNHLGDWGTQFGMLIQYLDEHPESAWHHDDLAAGTTAVSALDALYRAARVAFDADESFADRARARVVALQAGDEQTVATWRDIVAESEFAFREMYDRLGVLLTPEDSAGESFYNEWLPGIAEELADAGIAVNSDGALCVFSEEVTGPDGEPVPLMIRKKDGGYGYDTTDLATIRYRIRDLKADRILYIVDSRQSLHFRLIFEAARRAGWLTSDVDAVHAVHAAFGTVLGPNGKPFKTRSGDTVKLMSLLDAAVDRAREAVAEKNPQLTVAELDAIAEQAGIGAIKYADLSTSRTKDYVFDIDRMVSLNGNTGVYLQYAHARVCSILRKAGQETTALDPALRTRPSGTSSSPSTTSAPPSPKSATSANPTASAATSSNWPRRSLTSTRHARYSRPKKPYEPTGSRFAGSPHAPSARALTFSESRHQTGCNPARTNGSPLPPHSAPEAATTPERWIRPCRRAWAGRRAPRASVAARSPQRFGRGTRSREISHNAGLARFGVPPWRQSRNAPFAAHGRDRRALLDLTVHDMLTVGSRADRSAQPGASGVRSRAGSGFAVEKTEEHTAISSASAGHTATAFATGWPPPTAMFAARLAAVPVKIVIHGSHSGKVFPIQRASASGPCILRICRRSDMKVGRAHTGSVTLYDRANTPGSARGRGRCADHRPVRTRHPVCSPVDHSARGASTPCRYRFRRGLSGSHRTGFVAPSSILRHDESALCRLAYYLRGSTPRLGSVFLGSRKECRGIHRARFTGPTRRHPPGKRYEASLACAWDRPGCLVSSRDILWHSRGTSRRTSEHGSRTRR